MGIQVFQGEEYNLKLYLEKILSESKVQEGIQELSEEIQEINKKIQEIILSKQGELISFSSFSTTVQGTVELKEQIHALNRKFQGVKEKTSLKYQEISNLGKEVEVEIQKSILAKGLIRFFSLYKRLNTNLDSQLLQEISNLQQDLKNVEIVKEKMSEISEFKLKKQEYGSDLIEKGLENGDLQEIITGLGIFYNLQVLEKKILEILKKKLKEIEEIVQVSLKVQSIQGKGGVKRVNEPLLGDSQAKIWIKELWINVEKMTEEIYKECAKVYNLAKALEALGMEYNNDVTGTLKEELKDNIGVYFWNNFALVLEKGIRSAIKGTIFRN